MNTFQKALHVLSWIPLIAIKGTLAAIGLFVIPIAIATKWPKVFWIWNNNEEGCPQWWIDNSKDKNFVARLFPTWWWYAIRNPVNNFRYLISDREATVESNWNTDKPMEAQQMIDAGQGMAYKWSSNGLYAGYRRVWLKGQDKYSEIWFGWKVGSGVQGMGFTTQLRFNVEVGK